MIGLRVRCRKDLWKSTYGKNAFTKDAAYEIVREDDRGSYLLDDENNEFGPFIAFAGTSPGAFYSFDEYFETEPMASCEDA